MNAQQKTTNKTATQIDTSIQNMTKEHSTITERQKKSTLLRKSIRSRRTQQGKKNEENKNKKQIMKLGKKGIFFTIMALLVVAFMLATQRATTTPFTTSSADTMAARERITVMDKYLETFEAHVSNSLAVAGYLSLQNLSTRIKQGSGYIEDMNDSITDCFNETSPTKCLNETQYLRTLINYLTVPAASEFGITTQYRIERIWITEERPMEVVFWMNISYNVSDPFANWTIPTKTINAIVNVEGIEDPAYAYAYNKTIVVSTRNFTQYMRIGDIRNSSGFSKLYADRRYMRNQGINGNSPLIPFAPSILMRYTGNLTGGSVCCGVESIIRYDELNTTIKTGQAIKNSTYTDYQLFFDMESNTRKPLSNCLLGENGRFTMPGTFGAADEEQYVRLDVHHVYNVYNVSTNITFGNSSVGCG